MLQIKKILKPFIPNKLWKKLKNNYQILNNKLLVEFTKQEFIKILTDNLLIKTGSTVFIHSSLSNLKLSFPNYQIIPIIQEIIGSKGNLLFPCHQTTDKSLNNLKNNFPFYIDKTPSDVGLLSEFARRTKGAVRSKHPTNSIVAIGPDAEQLTSAHHKSILPCGELSPYYKIIGFNGIIIGLGVRMEHSLTFVHVVEDILYPEFPVITRDNNVFKGIIIDRNNESFFVDTLIPSDITRWQNRKIEYFFNKFIPNKFYNQFNIRKSFFYRVEPKEVLDEMINLAKTGITIYKKKAYTESKNLSKKN